MPKKRNQFSNLHKKLLPFVSSIFLAYFPGHCSCEDKQSKDEKINWRCIQFLHFYCFGGDVFRRQTLTYECTQVLFIGFQCWFFAVIVVVAVVAVVAVAVVVAIVVAIVVVFIVFIVFCGCYFMSRPEFSETTFKHQMSNSNYIDITNT